MLCGPRFLRHLPVAETLFASTVHPEREMERRISQAQLRHLVPRLRQEGILLKGLLSFKTARIF